MFSNGEFINFSTPIMSTESIADLSLKNNLQENSDLEKIKSSYDTIVAVQTKVLKNIYEIEADLDAEEYSEEIEYSGRRKKWITREFDLKGVDSSECEDDLEAIFGDRNGSKISGNNRNFKKNDIVVCVLERKKYKGVIFQVNNEGFIIKTKDRKKIKIPWGSPEESKVTLVKSKSASH